MSNLVIYGIFKRLQFRSLNYFSQCCLLDLVSLNVHRKFFHNGSVLLAGHSKWSNIKHVKGAKDAEKSTIFNKYTQLIKVACKGNVLLYSKIFVF